LSQNDPYFVPQSGEYIPPPPPYTGSSDIPPQSPYHYSAAPRQRNRGLIGWLGSGALAVYAVVKYGLLLALKIPALTTLGSAVISVAAWSLIFGPWAAVALVVMIFVHEMGHVVEIRRQGMQATAPIFIPFMGAAIFQRSHPTDALHQAQIGIAGPIAGTIGATIAFIFFTSTHAPIFLIAAWFGFFLNLINLIPAGMLDGGWILAPVSKWLLVAGYAVIAFGVFFLHAFSVLLFVIALLGLPMLIARFRNGDSPYYTSVPATAKWAIGLSWLGLVLYLGFMTLQAESLIAAVPR
jgi:Zn-dependent protease